MGILRGITGRTLKGFLKYSKEKSLNEFREKSNEENITEGIELKIPAGISARFFRDI